MGIHLPTKWSNPQELCSSSNEAIVFFEKLIYAGGNSSNEILDENNVPWYMKGHNFNQ